ncbi:MAG: nuclear transport factor 2 family protein [Anaeromyxobacter sp.]
MRAPSPLPLLALLALLLPPAPRAGDPAPAAGQADTRSLREADQALARAVAEGDRAAFAALLEERTLFGGGRRVLDGREAVAAAWAPFLTPGGPRLEWTPELAELARSGDVGYTIGRSTFRAAPDAPGEEGRYVTIWRRAPDGRFRVAIDLALRPPDPADPGPLTRTVTRTVTSRAKDLEARAGTFTAPGGRSGAFLLVRRRGPDGVLADALESIHFFPPPARQPE